MENNINGFTFNNCMVVRNGEIMSIVINVKKAAGIDTLNSAFV